MDSLRKKLNSLRLVIALGRTDQIILWRQLQNLEVLNQNDLRFVHTSCLPDELWSLLCAILSPERKQTDQAPPEVLAILKAKRRENHVRMINPLIQLPPGSNSHLRTHLIGLKGHMVMPICKGLKRKCNPTLYSGEVKIRSLKYQWLHSYP